MISPWMTKVIGMLPKSLVSFISRKVILGYVDKYADITVQGEENLLEVKKPAIYICNHLSNADGLVLHKVLNKYDDITFVAGVKLKGNSLTNLGLNIVKTTPVKPNTADKEGIKKIINILKSGNSILIFPEGTRSRVGKMIEGKKGILLIAKLTKAPIIPIAMTGTEKLLPINKEGKMEQEKFNYSKINMKIGKMFNLPKINKEENKKDYEIKCLNTIMHSIADLLPEEYRGAYSSTK
ncbi:lysophospholipid acyltransferase family protein [Clostridium sediminicola]|uniref:lysophospholipid acyltransferase family protein n=1 Tax=Clostridium sediminicola TaxID=3114879 RepID=UPI0031F20130